MKTIQIVCITGLLCVLIANLSADEKLSSIKAPSLQRPPVIDGCITKNEWSNAAELNNFITANKSQPNNSTVVLVGQTGQGLYVAFRCSIKNKSDLKTSNQKFDMNVWADDCVEIFLSTDGKRSKYYHFMVSADGSRQDEYCGHKSWSFSWDASSKIYDNEWICEIFIPFASIDIRSIKNLGINFCRNDRTGKIPQASQWAYTGGSFHTPERFGTLELSQFNMLNNNGAVSVFSAGPYWNGENKINVDWRKPSNRNLSISGAIRAYDENGIQLFQTNSVKLPDGQAGQIVLPVILNPKVAYIQPCLLTAKDTIKSGLLTPISICHNPELLLKEPYDGRIFQSVNPSAELNFDVLIPPDRIDATASLELNVRNVGSGLIAARKEIEKIYSNVIPVKWKLGDIPAGEYQILTVLKSGKGESYTLTSLFVISKWSSNYTRIDNHQRTVIKKYGDQERLFFPIGLFSRYLPKDEDYPKMKDAGFNCIQNYSFMYYDYQKCNDFLDTALKHEFMVIPSIKDYSNIWPPNSPPSPNCMTKDAINRAVARIVAHRDHPAILTWYSADEPAPQNATPQKLREYYKIIRQIDPLHPVSVAFCSSGEVKHFEDTYDICMPDLYPYPERVTQDYKIISKYFDDVETLVGNSRAVWATLQAYNKKYFIKDLFGADPNKFGRLFPAYEEIRNMTFQSLICGARGLLYYEKYRLFDDEHQLMWKGLRKTTREVNALSDILLAVDRVKAQITYTENIRGLWLKYDNDWYLLAVNTSKSQTAAKVALPENHDAVELKELLPPCEEGEMKMRESSHKIEVSENRIVLKFLPLGVRVIKMSTKEVMGK